MLRFNLLVTSICAILYIPLFIYFLFKKYRAERHIFCLAFYIYFCVLIKYTFFPIPVNLALFREMFEGQGLSTNIIPFKDIYNVLRMAYYGNVNIALKQLGGNMILLLPFGYFLPLIYNKFNSFIKVFIAALVLSASIETIQFIANNLMKFPYRAADIDDIILNVTGAILGYFIFKLSKPVIKKVLPSYTNATTN